MSKPSTLLAALLLTLATAAYADTTSGNSAPTKPVTGQGAATTVSTNPAVAESNGKADKGLDNAEAHIDAQHGKAHTQHKGSRQTATTQRAEHPAHVERPSVPERPSR